MQKSYAMNGLVREHGLVDCREEWASSVEKPYVVTAYLSARSGQSRRIGPCARVSKSLEPQGCHPHHLTGIVVEMAVAIRMYNGMPIVTL